MRNILLLGANGQVGFELARVLPPLGNLLCSTRSGRAGVAACRAADLAERGALTRMLDAVQPAVIVNAAAYTAVDRAEDEPALAQRINGEMPGEIGTWAARHNAAVLHFSTDYVFSGDGDRPWREDDDTAPLGEYGRSKLAGEQALAASGCNHLILRTAWVYAARGHNFLLSMLRLARQRDELRVVADQHGSPTPAASIAAATALLLARWLPMPDEARDERSGVYHLTSAGACTWHQFAEAIVERGHAVGLLSRRVPVVAIGSDEFPTRAKRPTWSVLDCSRLRETFDLVLPDWRRGLDLVLADLVAAGPVHTE
ncbi:MAG: dTDP-4-dehydrorhamnose reductase [Rhodanobacteraceae bacterium]